MISYRDSQMRHLSVSRALTRTGLKQLSESIQQFTHKKYQFDGKSDIVNAGTYVHSWLSFGRAAKKALRCENLGTARHMCQLIAAADCMLMSLPNNKK